MHFSELPIHKTIIRAISEKGYDAPTAVQAKTIPVILSKKDVIVSARTGTGKTAAFAIPILHQLIETNNNSRKQKKIKALIVCPTRELALQIQQNLKVYGKYSGISSGVIYGGTPILPQQEMLESGLDILVATPGRLLDLHKQDVVNLDYVETLVLDEADLMLDMGFIDDVKKIARLCPEQKQTLLFSATIPDKVEHLANTLLKSPEYIAVTPTASTAKGIRQQLYYVSKRNKIQLCLHLLKNEISGSMIIFRRTKFGVDKLEQTLLKNEYHVVSLHGNKSQNQRQEALSAFKKGKAQILIATDVAARGIDIKDVDVVLNFDLPNVPETYVHRIGRTARAGAEGLAVSLCSPDEKSYVKSIQLLINKKITVVETHPFSLHPEAKPEVHKKKGSKYKKGRKSKASKKKKKRWY